MYDYIKERHKLLFEAVVDDNSILEYLLEPTGQ